MAYGGGDGSPCRDFLGSLDLGVYAVGIKRNNEGRKDSRMGGSMEEIDST